MPANARIKKSAVNHVGTNAERTAATEAEPRGLTRKVSQSLNTTSVGNESSFISKILKDLL